jgi:hypothetical protein
MKIFLLSDNTHTLSGMRLSGVEGIVVHKREEILKELLKVKKKTGYRNSNYNRTISGKSTVGTK